ncbi:restriction endonuclease subunit S [Enterobacter kobei]
MVDLMVSEQQSGAAEKGVPVGFKLTEVGVIPQDWECVPFGNLFKTNIKKKNVSDHELVSFIGMQDVSDDAQLKNSTLLPFKEVKSGFTYFEKGDVLLAKITPCFENGKGCHTVELPTCVGFGSTEFHVLRENENSDSRFIYFWTTEKKFRSSLESEMVGSAGHRRVPLVAIKTYLIPCPKNRQEQSTIANTLSDVDDFIIASEKLIAKKQAIKTTTMQQLLTGKVRLPQFSLRKDGSVKGYKKSELGDIPEDWDISTIGKIAPLQRGFDLPSSARKEGVYPVVYSNGIINYHNTFQVKGPGVITGRSGTIGKVHYVTDDYWPHNTSLWVTKFNNANVKFIYYLYIYIGFERFSSGSGVPTLNRNDAHDYLVLVPPMEEQTAIAAILSDMDMDIQTLQQRLDKTRQLKQGMMQELLTGKTRLI